MQGRSEEGQGKRGCPRWGLAAGVERGSEQEELERETESRAVALGWSGAAV